MTEILDALGKPFEIPTDLEARPSHFQVGQLSLVCKNNLPLALVLVAAVRERYFLVWPITVTTGCETFPCIPLPTDPSFTVWPDVEFSLAKEYLTHAGPIIFSDTTMQEIVKALGENKPLPVQTALLSHSSSSHSDLTKVCNQAWELADLT